MATTAKSAPAKVIDRSPIVTNTVEKKKSMVLNVGHQDYIKLTKSKNGLDILKFSAGENNRNIPDAECIWHNVVMFGTTALAAYADIQQGDLIRVVGNLKASEYTSQKTGLSAVYVSLSAYSLEIVEKADSVKPDAQPDTVEVASDNIPF